MGLFKAVLVVLLAVVIYFVLLHGKKQYTADDVKGLNVVVSGASSGIGEQVAYKFASMGAKLMITARTETKLQKVVKKCKELGSPEAYYVAASQYSFKNASLVITEALEKLGGIDILVLNHIGQTYFGNYKYNVQDIEKLMMSNMLTHAHMSDLAMPSLSKRNGRIAVTSSSAGISGAPFIVPYATTKFALNGFFASLRHELLFNKTDVSVSLFHLGFTGTLGGLFMLPYTTTKFASNGFFTSLRHELLYNKTDVSVSLFHLGYIDTKLAEESIKYINLTASSKVDAVDEIVRGTITRESNVYFPQNLYTFTMLNAIMPDSISAYMRSLYRMPE